MLLNCQPSCPKLFNSGAPLFPLRSLFSPHWLPAQILVYGENFKTGLHCHTCLVRGPGGSSLVQLHTVECRDAALGARRAQLLAVPGLCQWHWQWQSRSTTSASDGSIRRIGSVSSSGALLMHRDRLPMLVSPSHPPRNQPQENAHTRTHKPQCEWTFPLKIRTYIDDL